VAKFCINVPYRSKRARNTSPLDLSPWLNTEMILSVQNNVLIRLRLHAKVFVQVINVVSVVRKMSVDIIKRNYSIRIFCLKCILQGDIFKIICRVKTGIIPHLLPTTRPGHRIVLANREVSGLPVITTIVRQSLLSLFGQITRLFDTILAKTVLFQPAISLKDSSRS